MIAKIDRALPDARNEVELKNGGVPPKAKQKKDLDRPEAAAAVPEEEPQPLVPARHRHLGLRLDIIA